MTPQPLTVSDAAALAAIARIAGQKAGLHLPSAKFPMIHARLRKRMRALGIASLGHYRTLIESPVGQSECDHMVMALTTHVSHFFREPHHFDLLRGTVLPPLVQRARQGGRVRLWSAGCAGGQEAYSLAMTVLQAMPDAARHDVRLLATDIDRTEVDKARRGRFSAADLAHIPGPLARQFLQATPSGPELPADMRRWMRFDVQNLHGHWPMRGGFDVIFCRNVLIYFDIPARDRLLARFAGVLRPGGWLFLGHSERLSGPAGAAFDHAGRTAFRRRDTPAPAQPDLAT